MQTLAIGGTTFRKEREMVDVTSVHRPDTDWRVVDRAGHEHRWYVGQDPATSYDPSAIHVTPTLRWVVDGQDYYEGDDKPHDVGHLECTKCGELVAPRYTADYYQQFIPGLTRFYVDDVPVSQEDFERRLAEAEATRQAG